jgi:hypothetical protein
MDIKNIKIKDNETIEIRISDNTKIRIEKTGEKSTFVSIKHYKTYLSNEINLREYSKYRESRKHKDCSWSTCESSFKNSDGTYVNVEHTAFHK